MIGQPVALSGDAEWPKVADAMIEAKLPIGKIGNFDTMHSKTKKEEKQGRAIVPVRQDAETLIAKAIKRNVSVDTMERLLVMRRELKVELAKEEFEGTHLKRDGS